MNVTLIGMGSGQPENLTLQGLAALRQADLILGARRPLAGLAATDGGFPRTAPPPTAPTRWQSYCRLPAQRTPCWSTAATPAFTPARPP